MTVEADVPVAPSGHGRGEIVATVDAGTGVFAVALGAGVGRTLFPCTAPSFAGHARRETRDAALPEVPAA